MILGKRRAGFENGGLIEVGLGKLLFGVYLVWGVGGALKVSE